MLQAASYNISKQEMTTYNSVSPSAQMLSQASKPLPAKPRRLVMFSPGDFIGKQVQMSTELKRHRANKTIFDLNSSFEMAKNKLQRRKK